MFATILLRAKAKPEKIKELKRLLAKYLPETRSYEGCIDIIIYEENDKEGIFVFYENWENFYAYERYLDYRTKQGVMDEIGALLTGAPEITYYNRVDI